MEYQYPFSIDWTKDEVIDVVHFFQMIEAAYEKGADQELLLNAYRRFKEIVPGKGDERRICDEFELESGYSPYKTMQKVKGASQGTVVKMQVQPTR